MPNHAIIDTGRNGVQGNREEWGSKLLPFFAFFCPFPAFLFYGLCFRPFQSFRPFPPSPYPPHHLPHIPSIPLLRPPKPKAESKLTTPRLVQRRRLRLRHPPLHRHGRRARRRLRVGQARRRVRRHERHERGPLRLVLRQARRVPAVAGSWPMAPGLLCDAN